MHDGMRATSACRNRAEVELNMFAFVEIVVLVAAIASLRVLFAVQRVDSKSPIISIISVRDACSFTASVFSAVNSFSFNNRYISKSNILLSFLLSFS